MKIRMLSIEELEAQGYKVVENEPGWYFVRTEDSYRKPWFNEVHKVLAESPSDFYIDYGFAIPKEFCEVLD